MKSKSLTILVVVLVLLFASASAWGLIGDRWSRSPSENSRNPPPATTPQAKTGPASARIRNLALQPEAFVMSRALGSRFDGNKREKSMLAGTLTIGADKRMVQIVRTQTDDGEQVEINLAGSGPLTWDQDEGSLSAGRRASDSERELIERLVLDSPDQFVLAQLRAASYRTIAVNVRPDKAGDNYRGPLWNIVRVDDPQTDPSKAPQSRWRLFYVNVATGLIDKIESEFQSQRITTQIDSWADSNGEKIPTEITWARQGQVLMHYSLNNFSHAEK
jgi:hypothetical protein